MKIDHVKSHKILRHRLVIHFQNQSFNWDQWISIEIDYYRLLVSSIGQAG